MGAPVGWAVSYESEAVLAQVRILPRPTNAATHVFQRSKFRLFLWKSTDVRFAYFFWLGL